MINLKHSTPSIFEFDMSMSGDLPGQIDVYLRIFFPNFGYTAFKAEHGTNGHYTVCIPALNNFPSGEFDCDIHVMVGDHFFVPFVDKCTIKDEPKPTIQNISSVAAKPSAPTIVLTPTPPPILTPIPEAAQSKQLELEPIKPEPPASRFANESYTPPKPSSENDMVAKLLKKVRG